MKKTIDDMRQIAAQRGGHCLSTEYAGARKPLLWKCKSGHEWQAIPVNITSRNSWCPYCKGQKSERFNIEYMQKIAKDRGGKCLSERYINSKTKLLWQCSLQHTWKAIPLNVVNKESWCPYCAKKNTTDGLVTKRVKKPAGYWNSLDHCFLEASRYQTKSAWQRGSPLSYRWASKNNWVEECTIHMREIRKPNGYWTLSRCKVEAQKFHTKAEWRLSHRTSFTKANKEGWMASCCEHMKVGQLWFGPASILEFLLSHGINYLAEHRFKGHPEVERRPFDFYLPDFDLVIEFQGEQHLIGWGRRAGDADKIQGRDAVKKKWAIANGIEYLDIKQWEINSKDDIHKILLEKLTRISQKNNQPLFLMKHQLTDVELQKVTSKIKWTLQACIDEAKKHKTRKEWQILNASSYQAAHKKGWLDECTVHMQRQLAPKGYWNLDRCIEDAKKYKTLHEWSDAKSSSYSVARSKKWVAQCTPHMTDGRKNSSKIIWTYDKCFELAKKCSSKAEFKRMSGSAYLRARVNGWLDACCAHMY